MKTMKFYSLKTAFFISFVAMVLSACGQSDKNTSQKNSVAEIPNVDINAAVLTGNLEAVRQHIEAGTDINAKDPMSGSSPLITASTFGKVDIAKALIDGGADLSIRNNDGATALHTAAFFCEVEIVQLLIDAKADKTIKNNYGATARESVMGPFDQIKPIYEMMQQQLGPFGMNLDMAELEKTRPVVAMMLQ